MQRMSSFSSPPQTSSTARQFTRTRSAPIASTTGPQATESNPKVIKLVQDTSLQNEFERYSIPFGVQFEIARLVQSGTFSYRDFDAHLAQVAQAVRGARKPNAKGINALHSRLMLETLRPPRESTISTPWATLDLEEKVLANDPHSGCIGHLDFNTLHADDLEDTQENPSSKYYFGGKIDFAARLRKEESSYSLSVQGAVLAQSNKLKRRFGSTSVLKCKIPNDLTKEGAEIADFFSGRAVVLWSWVYRAFAAKEGSIFLYKTNEKFCDDGSIRSNPDNNNRLPFEQLIYWIIPHRHNTSQAVSKWKSRMDLVLSTSVPGPLLRREDITIIDDLVSVEGSDMTDGCGYANLSLFRNIQDRYSLPEVPCAVQVRIFGAKGMLVLKSDAEDDGRPRIWLRKSQKKISYPENIDIDPSHRTLDILRLARVKSPSRSSNEVIINLSYNGVPTSELKDLQEADIKSALEPFMDLGQSDPAELMPMLQAVDRLGNVSSSRRSRQCTTELRFRGHEKDSRSSQDDESELAFGGQMNTWGPDPFSGCPSTHAETIWDMIVAGIIPRGNYFLRGRIQEFVEKLILKRCSENHWEIPQSATAFAVPDPYEVLGPDEIFFKSSRREFLDNDGLITDIITGDVLITRNPCKLPTDVRKVKAVVHPRLLNLVDCIVFPVQGKRRLIDYLAGGDYDGDRVMMIWRQGIVNSFTNAPEHFADEPQSIRDSFEKPTEIKKVKAYAIELGVMPTEDRISSLQRLLLSGLRDPFIIGSYSKRHERATFLFCTVLDAPKSGKKLLDNVRRNDIEQDPGRGAVLPWELQRISTAQRNQGTSSGTPNVLNRPRGADNTPFVMQELSDAAHYQFDTWKIRIEDVFNENRRPLSQTQLAFNLQTGTDKDLKDPWLTFDAAVTNSDCDASKHNRRTIRNHVESVLQDYKKAFRNDSSLGDKTYGAHRETLRHLSMKFISYPTPSDLRSFMDVETITRLRASYAYIRCSDDTRTPFPWRMAFRELCLIKARASVSGFRTAILDFADNFRLPKAVDTR
ncbi:hypothetical protein V5O48_011665 [Marasmius crinis-equi]|uniref:RNA-dependent RNA polymerase n=1 Tax=Marasmius crinis-equi TaxID=585013 RepID=A0ABR3F507_9AGAR